MKHNIYFSVIISGCLFLNLSGNAQPSATSKEAFAQSVTVAIGDKNAAAGTFRTMESIRFGMLEGHKGVIVKVEQPVCPDQPGTLSLVNPSGEAWKYKVIEKNGRLISEGDVGYDRRINHLPAGNYLIQFTLSTGISALDEFSITPGKGLEATMVSDAKSGLPVGKSISFAGKCAGASEFVWDFGDGTVSYGTEAAEHVYAKPGNYIVHFTSNNFDCSAKASETVLILPAQSLVSEE